MINVKFPTKFQISDKKSKNQEIKELNNKKIAQWQTAYGQRRTADDERPTANKNMQSFLIKLIEIYQKTLSPDTGWFSGRNPGAYCKYHPNCSEYGKQAIEKHGALKGGGRAIYRVLRCNPWSKGGVDLP